MGLVRRSTSLRLLEGFKKSGTPAAVNSNAAPKPANGSRVYAVKIPPVMLPGLIVPAPDNLPTVVASPIVPEPPRKAPLAMLTSVLMLPSMASRPASTTVLPE